MPPSAVRVSRSHRLITGPRAALEDALAATVRDAKAPDPFAPVTVLVGETLLRPYLRRRLAELLGGHLGVTFVTPGELALRLGEAELVAAGRRPMPPLLEPVLVRRAVADTSRFDPRSQYQEQLTMDHEPVWGRLRAIGADPGGLVTPRALIVTYGTGDA